jgi:hypothetical protein
MIIADVNLEMIALPLNLRAIISLALFGRIVLDKKLSGNPSFFVDVNALFMLAYVIYIVLVSFPYGLLDIDLIKNSFLAFIAAYCGYHIFFKTGDYRYLKISIILAGLICFSDLVYTYKVYGGFPVRRLYSIFSDKLVETNWNFFGYICGVSFVFLLNDFIHDHLNNKLIVLLLPVMLLGVIMSTSRSALLGLFVVSIVLFWNALRSRDKGNKIVNLLLIFLGCFIIVLLVFQGLKGLFHIDSSFVDKIMARLIDEPIAVLNKQLGNQYNVQALDSMEWREESSANAFDAFLNLSTIEQFFGIGMGGFLARDLGFGLNPHNGFLKILIETGIIGTMLYMLLILFMGRQSGLLKNHSSVLVAIAFIWVYCIGQNGEMTSTLIYLFIGTLIAQNKYTRMCNLTQT